MLIMGKFRILVRPMDVQHAIFRVKTWISYHRHLALIHALRKYYKLPQAKKVYIKSNYSHILMQIVTVMTVIL